MTDISNRTLSMLLLVAIAVSFLGILNAPSNGIITITGYAVNTTSGTANITIQTTTLITLVFNTVDFGVGFVNGTNNSCYLQSNLNTVTNSCQGFNAPAIAPFFLIANVGNVNVSLQMNGSFSNVTDFLCNATNPSQNCTLYDPGWPPSYTFVTAENLTGTCPAGIFAGRINISPQTLCPNMGFSSSSNKLEMIVALTLPRDSKVGQLRDNITFTATS